MVKVSKFGGSSLADAAQIKKVCDIILSDPDRKLIVVSAPGKRHKNDVKVTDLLISLAESYISGYDPDYDYRKVMERYAEIASGLGLDENIVEIIDRDLTERCLMDKTNRGEFLDSIKASGEDNCAKLIASYLQKLGHDAEYINPGEAGLILTEEYGNANVLPESYENLAYLYDASVIRIFPGFFGYSKNGDIVTLPRGGSDVSGSIVAAAVKAEMYENFTDVDSIFAVNPSLVDNPAPITDITYKEMRELAYAGFSVFHEEALTPVYYNDIPVHIKNTNNPSAPGTMIHAGVIPDSRKLITGIAGSSGFSSIYIRKYLMNREIGFGRKVFHILEKEGIPYEHSPSGIDDISVIIRTHYLSAEKEKRLYDLIMEELDVDDITITHGQALVMVVGENCLKKPETFFRAAKALYESDIVVKMINQGSSKVSIMFGMNEQYCDDAIRALYKEFFPDFQ
ncbi:MAG: aspartate kinase [Clostridia bacterium]